MNTDALTGPRIPSILCVALSVTFHGIALLVLAFKLNIASQTMPTNAETPAITVEIVAAPTPRPNLVTPTPVAPPPAELPPEAIEEPPVLIESAVAEEVVPPAPPPKVVSKPEPKPKPKPIKRQQQREPVETPAPPVDVTQAGPQPSQAAPAPPAQQHATAAPTGLAGPPADYMALLHGALERNKVYPRAAQQRRQEGRALLRFAIDRSGNVLDYHIEKSSGSAVLDREVVAMIKRASPLPPIPAEMKTNRLEVVVPIPFVLQ